MIALIHKQTVFPELVVTNNFSFSSFLLDSIIMNCNWSKDAKISPSNQKSVTLEHRTTF